MRLTAGAFWLTAAICSAQGSREDYERARSFSSRFGDKVYRDEVRPRWLDDGRTFWYRVEEGPEREAYVIVDAEKGERRAAFDATRLAAALASASGSEVPATRLPLGGLRFQDGGTRVDFRAFGKAWSCDLASYEVKEAPRAESAAASDSIPPLGRPRRTRRTGRETELTFVNSLKEELECFWISPEGERRSYGKVAPGQVRHQHTFAGHVWLIAGAAGRVVGVFEAPEDGGSVVLDGSLDKAVVDVESLRDRTRDGATSPDDRWKASIERNNVVVTDLKTGEAAPLTTDGTEDDFYEPRFFWSPDSLKLVVIQTRKGEERVIHLVESSPRDELQPVFKTIPYAKPGDKMPVPRPRLLDVAARKPVPVADALFPNAWEITDLRWKPDSSRFTFLYNQRGHQVLRIVAVDAATGEAKALIDETSKTFVDYAHKQFTRFVESTGEIIWMSERDGWSHLYLYDAASGQVKHQITRGEWIVRRVERVDEEKRQIWFAAGGIRPGEDPYYLHLCRVGFDGRGLTILTEGDGTHEWSFSPDRRFLIDTWSRVDDPPTTVLRNAEDGRQLALLERADASELMRAGWRAPERFIAKARDGATDIYGIIVRPAQLDPGRKYPVVEDIYAGPQSAFVPKSFGPTRRQHEIAELGFIVVQIDGMGTSQRSKAFHDVCWKNLVDAGLPDRVAWIRAAAATRSEMDLSRVGVYGGSAGGQSALGALLTHGDFYKVGVADCGCHDNRMDKIWWNELWMGWPIGPHYEAQSNVTLAHQLTGKLLLIVGELDTNVDPASTLQVVNALVKADKDFDLLVLPGVGHGAGGTPYGRRRLMDFLVKNLHGVEPRHEP